MLTAPPHARTFALHRQLRENIAQLLRSLTDEQLNRIPPGASNNLIWNAGHVVATAELLTYGLGGHALPSGRGFVDRYRKGTRPEGSVSAEEIAYIRRALSENAEGIQQAVGALDWSDYREYTTSFGVTLHDLGEALEFNNLHESMHLGTMLLLRRLVA